MINLSVHQLFDFKVHLEGRHGKSRHLYEGLMYGRRGKTLLRDLEYSLLGTRRFLTFLRETLLLGGEMHFVCSEKAVREFFLGLFRGNQGSVRVSRSLRDASHSSSVCVLIDKVDIPSGSTVRRMVGSVVLVPLNEATNTVKLDCIPVFIPRSTSFKCWMAFFISNLVRKFVVVRKVF